MKYWIAFLMLAFFFGARGARLGRESRTVTLIAGCVAFAFAIYTRQWY